MISPSAATASWCGGYALPLTDRNSFQKLVDDHAICIWRQPLAIYLLQWDSGTTSTVHDRVPVRWRLSMIRSSALGRNESQCYPVVAPAFLGGRWAVTKDMPLMPFATNAMVFGSRQNKFIVSGSSQVFRNSREKTWPTCPTVEFHGRGE